MTLLAATATHPLAGWLALAGAAFVCALIYAVSCWWFPFAHCSCSGGKVMREDGKVFRVCRRCGGSGRRLRVGRRVWNHFAAKRGSAG